jgi:diazepam-binding inhibitor (GABA receptor modulating acyl-CoA-binding protein)
MSAPQSDAFKKAVTDSKKLTSKPSNDDLLQLYGGHAPCSSSPIRFCCILTDDYFTALYKIATGEDVSKAPTPGMFDLKVRVPVRPHLLHRFSQ